MHPAIADLEIVTVASMREVLDARAWLSREQFGHGAVRQRWAAEVPTAWTNCDVRTAPPRLINLRHGSRGPAHPPLPSALDSDFVSDKILDAVSRDTGQQHLLGEWRVACNRFHNSFDHHSAYRVDEADNARPAPLFDRSTSPINPYISVLACRLRAKAQMRNARSLDGSSPRRRLVMPVAAATG